MIILLWLLALGPQAHAIETKQVDCYAWTHNQTTGDAETVQLKISKMDPNYYSATLNQFEFGADYSFLKSDGIGLIVYDNKSRRFTESTPGFRRIGDTNHRETDLKFYDQRPDGSTFVAGLQCEIK